MATYRNRRCAGISSNAIIIAFNVQADAKARETLAREGVDLRLYDVIYNAIDDVRAALQGMLAEIREEVIGRCRVDDLQRQSHR